MSTENDNLPLADGQDENNLKKENQNSGLESSENFNETENSDRENNEIQTENPESASNEDLKEKSESVDSEQLDSTEQTNTEVADSPLEEETTGQPLVDIQIHEENEPEAPKIEETNPESSATLPETDPVENPDPDTGELELDGSKEVKSEPSETDFEPVLESSEKPGNSDFDDTADHDQHHDDEKEDDHDEEDETKAIPEKDYDEMSLGDMVQEAGHLLAAYAPLALRKAFNNLKDAFRKKSDEEEKEAKEKFLETGGNEIDFRHENRHATKFYDTYTEYRSRIDTHYKNEQAEQEKNLKEREAIIDELKALYTEPSQNNSHIFKRFRELKTRWHNAGRIPKAQAANLFRTYYFHLDNFNRFLDLNQELRKMDYEHNLEVRHSIIAKAKALLEEDNVQKALNDLQYLHRMWKEEAVPVAEEHREPTWQEFKELTGKIHDRKTELNQQITERQQQNLEKKQDVIARISNIMKEEVPNSHNAWQKKIRDMKALRDEFFAIGRVPKEFNQSTWDAFKDASKDFNHEKNSFYKHLKDEQMENLEKKKKLVEIANEHKVSTDWNESVKVVKRIQAEWKTIGHVPRKYSDKIWKEFSEANNTFFDRYKNRNNEKVEKQQLNLELKEGILKEMEKAEKPKEKEALLAWLNDYSIKWSAVGFVPNGKQDINRNFTSLTEKILTEAGMSKDAIESAQWESKVDHIKINLDEHMLKNLKFDLRKQIDEVQKDVTQLQTNLAFFSNADDKNPLFKNAIQNIENKVNELKSLETRFDSLKHINLEAIAEARKNAESEANINEEKGTEE